MVLTGGIPFGLVMGLFASDWGRSTVISALTLGLVVAVIEWFRPARPLGVTEDGWDALSMRERRTIIDAVARGEAVPGSRVNAAIAARIAEEQVRRGRGWRDRLTMTGLVALSVLLVVEAGLHSAPPGWIAAGCVWVLFWCAVAIRVRSRAALERVSRAAAINRRTLAA